LTQFIIKMIQSAQEHHEIYNDVLLNELYLFAQGRKRMLIISDSKIMLMGLENKNKLYNVSSCCLSKNTNLNVSKLKKQAL
jgi:hypothetical protein